MYEDGHVECDTVLKKCDDTGVVEIAVTDVIADLNPPVTVVDRALEFSAGQVGILQGDLTEGYQPASPSIGDFKRAIVEYFRHVGSDLSALFVTEEYRCGRNYLCCDTIFLLATQAHIAI